jgi:murein DD-endopeptidase MepM/ murein hydrolase activator NlpD
MRQKSPQTRSKRPAPPIIALAVGGKVRSWRLRPGICLGAAAGIVALCTVTIGSATLLLLNDAVPAAVALREENDRAAYEERIAALRAELDRATSKRVVATHAVEDQVALLLDRHNALAARQEQLDEVLSKAAASGIAIAELAPPMPRPRPTDVVPRAGPDAPLAYAPSPGPDAEAVRPLLKDIQSSLDTLKDRQSRVLDVLALASREEAERIAGALRPIGFDRTADFGGGRGGPLVPAGALSFGERAELLNAALDQVTGLRRASVELPLRQPLREGRRTSSFGYRIDPFVGKAALHSGLDLAAPEGTNVTATAPGIVVAADWNGGYGQMVEIRHAHGFSTRYGHLSAIFVSPGARVTAGTVIGRVGSTGRSTGPHLHYETRTRGGPVDPALFIAAGNAL